MLAVFRTNGDGDRRRLLIGFTSYAEASKYAFEEANRERGLLPNAPTVDVYGPNGYAVYIGLYRILTFTVETISE